MSSKQPLTVAVGLAMEDMELWSMWPLVWVALTTEPTLADMMPEALVDSMMVEMGLRVVPLVDGAGSWVRFNWSNRLLVLPLTEDDTLLLELLLLLLLVPVELGFLKLISLCDGPKRLNFDVPLELGLTVVSFALICLWFWRELLSLEVVELVGGALARHTTAGLVALDNEPIWGIDDVDEGRGDLVLLAPEPEVIEVVVRFVGRDGPNWGKPVEGEVTCEPEVDNDDDGGEVIPLVVVVLGEVTTGDNERDDGTAKPKQQKNTYH